MSQRCSRARGYATRGDATPPPPSPVPHMSFRPGGEGQDNARNAQSKKYPIDTQIDQEFDTQPQKIELLAKAARTLPPREDPRPQGSRLHPHPSRRAWLLQPDANAPESSRQPSRILAGMAQGMWPASTTLRRDAVLHHKRPICLARQNSASARCGRPRPPRAATRRPCARARACPDRSPHAMRVPTRPRPTPKDAPTTGGRC